MAADSAASVGRTEPALRDLIAESPFHFSLRANRAQEIPWQEWDAYAFDQARAQDRPILLAIGASWCHRCHVMDETTYSDERVIDLLSSRFVCIRVDADERPDVNARYGVGESPTVAFLTSDGDAVSTTGYQDPGQMLAAMKRMLDGWYADREAIIQQVEAARVMRAAERAAARAERTPGRLTPSILDQALEIVQERFDPEHSGLIEDGAEPGSERASVRFPRTDVLRLWRYSYHRRNDGPAFNRAFDMARAMVEGGLYDRADGGFFRASKQADWSQPHAEKLARDQGRALLALAELALSDEEARDTLLEAAEGTARFLTETLGDAQGAIFASQDADETWHHATLDERAAMEPPQVDRRVFTASAAVAARGLIAAGIAFDRRDWVERGRRAVDFLLYHLRAGEAGMYHEYDAASGGARHFGILDDQTQMLLAFLEAYEVSGQPLYFEHARALGVLIERDWLEPGIGFRDLSYDHDETAMLAEPAYPLPVNVATAEAFIWLGRLTHDDRYLSTAQETLGAFAHGLERRGLGVADYARVVDRLLSAEPEFKIVAEFPAGEPDRVADPLHQRALRLPLAGRTVQRLNTTTDEVLMLQLGLPRVPKVAYVCAGTTCSSQVTDPDALEGAIEDVLAAPSW